MQITYALAHPYQGQMTLVSEDHWTGSESPAVMLQVSSEYQGRTFSAGCSILLTEQSTSVSEFFQDAGARHSCGRHERHIQRPLLHTLESKIEALVDAADLCLDGSPEYLLGDTKDTLMSMLHQGIEAVHDASKFSIPCLMETLSDLRIRLAALSFLARNNYVAKEPVGQLFFMALQELYSWSQASHGIVPEAVVIQLSDTASHIQNAANTLGLGQKMISRPGEDGREESPKSK